MVDYSKWKDIEVSDDEDDTHPNIDTPSLFRWRHTARLERMAEIDKEKKELEDQKTKIDQKKKKLKDEAPNMDMSTLKKEIEKEEAVLKKAEDDFSKKQRLTPWNVDTIGKEGFSKSVLNTKPKEEQKPLTDEEKAVKLADFSKKYKSVCEKFGMLRKYDDSRRFLLEHPHLACDETCNYLVIWCINLALEDKFELMDHVSHQCICMQFLLELAKQIDTDPRACISSFFSKIAHVEQTDYKEAFNEELRLFRDRIRNRAIEKIAEAEEEERQARLGPGGLDPVEVIDTLPQIMKECFEKRDIGMLQEAIKDMPVEEAQYHMKRCIDSGLWVPPQADEVGDSGDTGTEHEQDQEEEEEEPIYSDAKESI